MDGIIGALPGAVSGKGKDAPNTPATTPEQRAALGRRAEYKVDRCYGGVQCCPTPFLLVELKTCSPCSAEYLAASPSSAVQPAVAAAAMQRKGLATYAPVLHPTHTLQCFAMEIFGGCTRVQPDGGGLVETLQRYAMEIAKAQVPGVDMAAEAAGVARQRIAAEILQGWRTTASVELARARGRFFAGAILDCVQGASGEAVAVPPIYLPSHRLDLRALGGGAEVV